MLVQQQCALIWHKFVTLAKFKQNFGHSFKLLNKNFAPLDDRPISTTQESFYTQFFKYNDSRLVIYYDFKALLGNPRGHIAG